MSGMRHGVLRYLRFSFKPGARSPVAGTARQTFVLGPDGTLRWQEQNIEFGIGEFSVERHAARVLRELFQIHNADGWSV